MRLFQGTRSFLTGGLVALALAGAFFVGKNMGSASAKTVSRTDQTVILERIRAMGDLRTAEATYSDLVVHRSWQTPTSAWAHIPGVTSLVRASTENRHLVRATGKVEAGFDLSKARIAFSDRESVVIYLPPVHFKVRIEDAEAIDSRSGLFWRNENGSLEAEQQARSAFLESAKSSRLKQDAHKNAGKLLQDLMATFGVGRVEVRSQSPLS